MSHFGYLLRAPPDANLVDIIRVVILFPRYVDQDACEDIINIVTMREVEATIKRFNKDKILGPDGWSIEFYISLFDIIGQELVQVIEEC